MANHLQEPSGTRSEDYSSTYYNDAHLGGYDDYTWDNKEYRAFFRVVAERVAGAVNPRTVLDVGCARGLLVQAFAERDIDARGVDISEHAIESSHADVRERLSVASATEPFSGRFDLITCIEVLEHMSAFDAQLAIDNITAATDRVLFSSSPGDHDEPTHVNTHSTALWAAWFAERGFFRRTDVDLSFLTPWAVLFERSDLTLHTLTQRYEQQFATVNTELQEKRSSLLESHRRIATLNEQLLEQTSPKLAEQEEQTRHQLAEQAKLIKTWEAEVLGARHQLLTTRDHVVGTEAEVARLTRDNEKLVQDLVRARRQVVNLRSRLKDVRARVRRLSRRNRQLSGELEAGLRRPSVAKRAARKMLGGAR